MAKNKREIDKDTMYSKIMPSSYKNTDREPSSGVSSTEPVKVAAAVPAKMTSAPKPSLFTKDNGVQLKEKNRTLLVNIMEKLVVEKLDAAFAKFNCCKCDRCKQDVAAIALNKLTPKYVVTDQSSMIDLISRQTSAEVTTAIIKAILIVRANPRH
ncbi:late competence development ComFB family protein [Oscillospiraceae bacterium PP1C4]